jgi:hypothetical protein
MDLNYPLMVLEVVLIVVLYYYIRSDIKILFRESVEDDLLDLKKVIKKDLQEYVLKEVVRKSLNLQQEVKRLREKRNWVTLFVRIYGLDEKYTRRTTRERPTLYVPIQMSVSTGELRATPDRQRLIGGEEMLQDQWFCSPTGDAIKPDFVIDLGCPPYRPISDHEILMLDRVYTMLS